MSNNKSNECPFLSLDMMREIIMAIICVTGGQKHAFLTMQDYYGERMKEQAMGYTNIFRTAPQVASAKPQMYNIRRQQMTSKVYIVYIYNRVLHEMFSLEIN